MVRRHQVGQCVEAGVGGLASGALGLLPAARCAWCAVGRSNHPARPAPAPSPSFLPSSAPGPPVLPAGPLPAPTKTAARAQKSDGLQGSSTTCAGRIWCWGKQAFARERDISELARLVCLVERHPTPPGRGAFGVAREWGQKPPGCGGATAGWRSAGAWNFGLFNGIAAQHPASTGFYHRFLLPVFTTAFRALVTGVGHLGLRGLRAPGPTAAKPARPGRWA